MNNRQLKLEDKITSGILYPQSDAVTNLLNMVNEVKKKRWVPPRHQRGRVWPPQKIDNWVYRIKNLNLRPIGCVATYQVTDSEDFSVYINDGLQRVTASSLYLAEPERYGDSKDIAEQILMSVELPRQHRHYKEHADALRDFQYINMGTSLTAKEYCSGILVYMENYDTIWEQVINNLTSELLISGEFIVHKQKLTRQRKHQLTRDGYALFHRFATRDKSLSAYKVANPQADYHAVEKKDVVEWKLRNYLESSTRQLVDEDLGKFINLVKRETSLIKHVWHEELKYPSGQTPIPTMYRWLLHCSVWKSNNAVVSEIWRDFLYKVLDHTKGKSSVALIKDSGAPERRNTGLGTLNQLRTIATVVGSDIVSCVDNQKPRKKHSPLNEPGIDESHQLPFADFGEGPTFPEPASRNRARGKNPVE